MRSKGILIGGLPERSKSILDTLQQSGAVIKIENPVTGEFETMTYEQLKQLEQEGYTIEVVANPVHMTKTVPFSEKMIKQFEDSLRTMEMVNPLPIREPFYRGLDKGKKTPFRVK